ncbi:MAG: chlorophyll A-B-binding protein [Cyanobacteria bacterium Co-bin8]|nr:chlorophyll A-B-binding protein [Cyanobacteria bacterium Co-bin8]
MSTETENTPVQTKEPQTSALPPSDLNPSFGWTRYAETINGRFAMIGFTALLILEFVTHQDFFTWVGLR